MARIKYQIMAEQYDSLRSASSRYGERSDCSVIAIAAACNVPYEVAHSALKAQGRRDRCGTYIWMSKDAIKALGYKAELIDRQHFISQYPGIHSTLKNVTTHHPDRFKSVWKDGHNYIISNKTHMLAVIDGENVDWTKGRAMRATRIWRITKVEN